MRSMIPLRYTIVPLFLSIVLGMLLMSACAPTEQSQESATAQQQDKVSTSWSAILDISGGFAGQMHQISIDQTGQAVLIDKKTKSRFEKQVTPQELQNIAKLVKLLPVQPSPDIRTSQCRDCRNYQLVATYEGTTQLRKVDDLGLQDSDAKQLIQSLITLASGIKK